MLKIKAENMTSSKGNLVPNQFIIRDNEHDKIYFQSYDSIIAMIDYNSDGGKVYLDKKYWNYSRTTGKYRNDFLNESLAETKKKINSGEYTLIHLN